MEVFSENFKVKHPLIKIDARIKLIVAITLLIMILSYKGIIFPLLIATGCVLLCLKMQIPFRVLILRFAQPMFIALIVLVLKFFSTGEEVLFSIDILSFNIVGYKDGFMQGMYIMSRIIGGVSLVITLGFATPFTEFMAALSWLKVPRQFIEIMMFAYRYLFVFLEDGFTIYNAQKNRLGYAGIRKGLKSFGTLTGSLVLRSFEQSQKTSEAMIQRGYTGDMPLFKSKPLKASEVTISVIFLIFMGLIWMIH